MATVALDTDVDTLYGDKGNLGIIPFISIRNHSYIAGTLYPQFSDSNKLLVYMICVVLSLVKNHPVC